MFGKIKITSYEIIEIILMIILMIAVLAFIGVVVYNKVTNSPEKLKRKYINEGYKGEIVIIENDNKNTKEILIKNNNELVEAIKKEIVKKEIEK